MKFQFYFLLFFFLCIFNNTTYAQDPFDCINAIEVCDDSDINIDYEIVEGVVEEEISSFCNITSIPQTFLNENTVWIRYQFISDGDFLFTISPIMEDDIDFVVFSTESKSCNDLTAIRCMFTGSNIGSPTDPACTGPTGLSATSTDTEEAPGCQDDSDNFLAPIEVIVGDVLYLAIISFAQINEYMIEHGGSAEISCMPVGINDINSEDVKIYPNPTYDQLYIEMAKNEGQKYNFELLNSTGKSVLTDNFIDKIELDIQHLPRGIYYSKIWSSDEVFYGKKIIKVK